MSAEESQIYTLLCKQYISGKDLIIETVNTALIIMRFRVIDILNCSLYYSSYCKIKNAQSGVAIPSFFVGFGVKLGRD